MIALTLGLIGVAVVQALVFAEALRRQAREHARERNLLLNQLLHAVGRPWQEAPAEHREPPAVPEAPGFALVLDPDQLV